MKINNMEEVFKLLLNDEYSGSIYLKSDEEIQEFKKISVVVHDNKVFAALAYKETNIENVIYLFEMICTDKEVALRLVDDETLKEILTNKLFEKISMEEIEEILM